MSFDCKMNITKLNIEKNALELSAVIHCPFYPNATLPKVKIVFECGGKTRRLPIRVTDFLRDEESGICTVICEYSYFIDKLFYRLTINGDITAKINFYYGENEVLSVPFTVSQDAVNDNSNVKADCENGSVMISNAAQIIKHAHSQRRRFNLKYLIHILAKLCFTPLTLYYKLLCKKDVVPNRVTFMSGRRDELGGNSKFVYDIIKNRSDIDFKFLLFSDPKGHRNLKIISKFLKLYASSKVVIIDDYFRLLNWAEKRSDVKLYQLWHACGAFKTFGFARLGKPGGPTQRSENHRMYDYAIVSSKNIAKDYAESFGLSDECILATGIPRTDVFMDPEYSDSVRTRFYEKHPQLKNKKIMLFAPTFRGNGQMSAYYPLSQFHPKEVYEALGGQYAILIKLHPFCRERFEIPNQYADFILDLSDEDELNDLLFVTDLLVTDYSSAVFEASLLNIPMLFYAFDLEEYIAERDFYYDFQSFVPGKIVFSENEFIEAVLNNDFEQEKVTGFKTKFFDDLDGRSSQRVAEHIINVLQGSAQ